MTDNWFLLPALPARWLAAALEMGVTINDSIPIIKIKIIVVEKSNDRMSW